MIASVVATIDKYAGNLRDTIDEISRIPCVELGSSGNGDYRLPMLIDSPDPNALEEVTRRLQQCRGVAFVDVVFVHFEDEPHSTAATPSGKPANL